MSTTEEAVNDEKVFSENKKRLDEIYELTHKVFSLSLEDVKKKYSELSGETAPETTMKWLQQAVIRKIQNKYYSDRGIEVPEKIRKNDDAFFSSKPPSRDAEKEKPAKKEKSAVNSEEKEQVKKIVNSEVDSLLLVWKEGASTDIIAKRKKEHEKLQLQFIYDAGNKGIIAKDLYVKVEKHLTDKSHWEKNKPVNHLKYIIKTFSSYISC